MSAGSPGALARAGVHPNPVGTLAELHARGINTASVGCCAPPSPGVRGCVWAAVDPQTGKYPCPFDRLDMNGGKWTKGDGPRNVGVRIVTHEGATMQDFFPCFNFVRTLEGRRQSAMVAKAEGRSDYEVIRIIGQQGDTIRRKITIPIDPMNTKAGFHAPVMPCVIPAHPRPNDLPDLSFAAEVMEEERKLEGREREAVRRMYAEDQEDSFSDVGSEPDPVAYPPQPEKRGPGRPRKVVSEPEDVAGA